MVAFASLPTCLSITSTSVQSGATFISVRLYFIRSLPSMSSLQVFAARARSAHNIRAKPTISFLIMNSPLVARHAQSLLHDRARGGVLQELLFLRKQMVLDAESG